MRTEIPRSLETRTHSLRSVGARLVERIRDEASGLHGIMRTADGWAGGADPRREGVALGD